MPLTDTARKMIDELEETRVRQLKDLSATEYLINEILSRGGEQPRYAPSAAEAERANASRPPVGLKRGQFYMKPLATAVREYLLTRTEPMTADEIMQGLEAGEFDFDALAWKRETRARSLAMSLAKNTATFHRLPSGTFGLREWYNLPATPKRKGTDAGADGTDSASVPDVPEEANE